MTIAVALFIFVFVFFTLSGATKFSGRSMTLLDPTYAKKYVPIIASVSEHQPTSWHTYYFDLGFIFVFVPIGFYYCLVHKCTLGKLFLAMYGVLATYFSCVMIRLMLVLAPVACILAAIAISEILRKASKSIRLWLVNGSEDSDATVAEKPKPLKTASISGGSLPKMRFSIDVAAVIIIFLLTHMTSQVFHSTMLSAEAYSSPSIIMSGRRNDGSRFIIDDYREAYYWMKQNTPKGSKIMAWWDYGYQISGMSNRTVIVDNNTWNNTHIATVGKAFASPEAEAHEVARKLDADYMLVIFGGLSHFSGDDISKFLWMVRIAAGVYPKIKEHDFYNNGHYRVDKGVSETMKNSLMYRLAYYRFGEMRTRGDRPSGYDTVRDCEIGLKEWDLKYFMEAYTSERWIVRIFKVLPLPHRDARMDGRYKATSTPPELPEGKFKVEDLFAVMPEI